MIEPHSAAALFRKAKDMFSWRSIVVSNRMRMSRLQGTMRYMCICMIIVLLLCIFCLSVYAYDSEKLEEDRRYYSTRIPVVELKSLDNLNKDFMWYDYVINSASGASVTFPTPISADSIVDITIDIAPLQNETPSFSKPISLTEVREITVLIHSNTTLRKCIFHFDHSFYGGTFHLDTGIGYKWEHIVFEPQIFDTLIFEDGQLRVKNLPNIDGNRNHLLFCTHAKTFSGSFKDLPDNSVLGSGKTIAIRNDRLKNLDMWKDFLEAQYINGTPLEITYQSLFGQSVTFSDGVSLPDDVSIESIRCDYGTVNVCYGGRKELYSTDSNLTSCLRLDSPKDIVIVKIPKYRDDNSALIPRVGCGEIFFADGKPEFCIPKTVKEFSLELNAPVVMNGGFFARSAGTNVPHGSIISDGKIIIDNVYENDYHEMALCIDSEGCFRYVYSDQLDCKELIRDGVTQCLCGMGPIISDRKILHDMIRSYGGSEKTINVLSYDENFYYILTSSNKITLEFAADILKSLNVMEAYVMDGGGSVGTTVFFNKINKNIDAVGDRLVADIIFFK